MTNDFLTIVLRLPQDTDARAHLLAELKFGNGEFRGAEVTAMGLGDAISELESLGL